MAVCAVPAVGDLFVLLVDNREVDSALIGTPQLQQIILSEK